MTKSKMDKPILMSSEEEEFAQLFSEGIGASESVSIRRGETVTGRIVGISNDAVFVNLGGKAEGIIDVRELADEKLKIGDSIEATVVSTRGGVQLSQKLTGRLHDHRALAEAYELGLPVEGKVSGTNKGGFEVIVAGQKAFVPISQLALERIDEPELWVGQVHRFKVTEYAPDSRRIVLSRSQLLREERAVKAEKLWDTIQVGQSFSGQVTSVQEYGCFVDIGGVDGLVHRKEMQWAHLGHPSDLVSPGQEVQTTVLSIDRERNRIGLTMKSAEGNPWHAVGQDIQVGDKRRGTVTRVEKYGVFVEIVPGLEGLAHISELTFARRVRHPSELVSVGDQVDVVLLDINKAEQRIALSMKQVHGDPWKTVGDHFPVGTIVSGTVERAERFGVFVSVQEGITALLPTSEMDVTPSRDLTRLFPTGAPIEAVVISLEPDERKMALSQRQAALEKESAEVAKWQAENKGRHGMGTFAELLSTTKIDPKD